MKNRILGTTAFAVVATTPFVALAQTAEPAAVASQATATLDEIVVTGSYRRSLEEAVDIKRKTVGFSDSIVATDVANFPEQNLAEALQRIPLGETRSYAGLAAEIGNPAAVRAVARACARNPVALAVPCHRVVGSGGDLTGYRWGVPRKAALLAAEAKARR